MRVEVIPDGFGDWDSLVTHLNTGNGWGGREITHQFLAMCTAQQLERRSVNTRSPAALEQNNGEEKLKELRGFEGHILAGVWAGQSEGAIFCPIYHKGQNVIVDGFYATGVPHWEARMARAGRIMVCFQRRGRITPDRFAFSSEQPIALGTLTAVNGNTVNVSYPAIEGVAFSGDHQIDVPDDATFHRAGVTITSDEALRVGQMLMIYPARPQTIVVNAGLPQE